ncbi:PIN domain-containing protein [Pseudonocardia sp.]|uniref:type II toxin-antitoxin system VapC family toxin n=1 Tax=Pseudonocardia sp. TaxID=60912 RepID=UPI002613F6F5|nr:PIN domain-containing protein [Pseudonocardia sp.]
MGAVVVDASVVLAFLNPRDTMGAAVRRVLGACRERADTFVLPASVLAESLVWTARDRPDRLADMVSRLTSLFGPGRVVDRDVAVAAARLRAGHRSLRLPDALMLAVGVIENATVLTCDTRLRAVDPRVQVVGA